MSEYDIETIAQLTGVSTATLRAWQRYGLLQPARSPVGHRLYDENDLTKVHAIRHWVARGTELAKIKRLLAGVGQSGPDEGWQTLMESIRALLIAPQPARLRRLIWRYGREYPAFSLVCDILRPLRRRLGLDPQPMALQQRSLLDGVILEYATFILNSARKKTGAPVVLIAWQSNDAIDLWLEAIRLSAEGLRIDIMPSSVPQPDLTLYQAEHYLLWTDKRLTAEQQACYDAWLAQGIPVMLLGPGALSRKRLRVVDNSLPSRLDMDDLL